MSFGLLEVSLGLDNAAAIASTDDRQDMDDQVRTSVGLEDLVESARRQGPAAGLTEYRDLAIGQASNCGSVETFLGQSGPQGPLPNPVVGLPAKDVARRASPALVAQQEWEGTVLSVDDDVFVARLLDVTWGAAFEEEEATIPRGELSDDDLAKVTPGSVFRWVVGYEKSASGTRRRVSQIVFRDLPRVTAEDADRSETWADELLDAFQG